MKQNNTAHPEMAIGIPATVVTAIRWTTREQAAKALDYTGPLSLADAVATGRLTALAAERMIAEWERNTGRTFRPVPHTQPAAQPKAHRDVSAPVPGVPR